MDNTDDALDDLKQKLMDLKAFVERTVLSFTELCTEFRLQYGMNLQCYYESTGTSTVSQLLRRCSDVALVSFDEDSRRYTISLYPPSNSTRS